jgi:hypothetical protein
VRHRLLSEVPPTPGDDLFITADIMIA